MGWVYPAMFKKANEKNNYLARAALVRRFGFTPNDATRGSKLALMRKAVFILN